MHRAQREARVHRRVLDGVPGTGQKSYRPDSGGQQRYPPSIPACAASRAPRQGRLVGGRAVDILGLDNASAVPPGAFRRAGSRPAPRAPGEGVPGSSLPNTATIAFGGIDSGIWALGEPSFRVARPACGPSSSASAVPRTARAAHARRVGALVVEDQVTPSRPAAEPRARPVPRRRGSWTGTTPTLIHTPQFSLRCKGQLQQIAPFVISCCCLLLKRTPIRCRGETVPRFDFETLPAAVLLRRR